MLPKDKEFLIKNHLKHTRNEFKAMFDCSLNQIDQVLHKEGISCKSGRGKNTRVKKNIVDKDELLEDRRDFQWVS